MNVLLTLLLAAQMLTALGMIGLILLQHGKGADMGAAFGSGASGSLFGATGSANFLSRTTAVLAAVFFLLSLALAYVATNRPVEQGGGALDAVRQQQPQDPVKQHQDIRNPQNQPPKPAAESAQKPAPAPAEAPKERQVPQ